MRNVADLYLLSLAYAEMRVILARMLWNFDMELQPESQNWDDQKVGLRANELLRHLSNYFPGLASVGENPIDGKAHPTQTLRIGVL